MEHEGDKKTPTGRILLFEPDPLKRHYFGKYVLGGIWRGLTEAERQERTIQTLKQRAREGDGAGPSVTYT